ncbi:neuronal PAS domain-containing protein 4-like [Centroberyx affinis]|uniref:neuronal PAS domain-containing protein 4-like n=1 Tax=Centroberyx affinis TaxID=166261 RepID=UPI003A5BF848
MTIWCDSCKCHVSAPCTSHHFPVDHRRAVCRRSRSTKGASKARRDHINNEIRNMRALLPITQDDQERLSYLHSMSAICTYIRKSVLFQGFPAVKRSGCSLPYEAFLQALHGFILVTTAHGRLVYVSENVAEYLGHSMVDVLQGDTFYDLVERSDIDIVKSNLKIDNNSSTERSFVCCMQTSKAFRLQHGSCCSMLVRGSFQCFPQPRPASASVCPAEELLFVALCTPTVNRLRSADSAHLCQSFSSVHSLDMTFTQLSDSGFYFLGYSAEEMSGRSWYSLLHPEDLSSSADSHKSLMQADEGFQVEMVLRLQHKDLSWTWVYVQAIKDSECQEISCTNYIISETEARFLLQKTNSDAFRPSCQTNSCHSAAAQMPHTQGCDLTKRFKRQRTSDSQSEEPGAKTRRGYERDILYVARASSQGDGSPAPAGDGPALFTPPYSPASSGSPLQEDELSPDFLMDVHGYTDRLLSSPEGSPSYYSYPEAGPACHQSPSDSLPAAAEYTFDQGGSSMTGDRSPDASLSPAYDFQARLVPDRLSASDVCESPADCGLHQDDFGLLEQPQGGSSFQVCLVPHSVLSLHSSLLTPNPSPTSQESFQYNERERVEISILAQQISSLASSFDMYRTLSPVQNTSQAATESPPLSACDWPQRPPPPTVVPLKPELVLDDGVFDSILKDLEMVAGKGPGVVSYSYQQGSACRRTVTHQLDREPPHLSPSSPEDSLPTEQFGPASITSMDPFTFQLGSHDQNTGLHQLNHYLHSSLQQDGLVEENLY